MKISHHLAGLPVTMLEDAIQSILMMIKPGVFLKE